MRDRQQDILLLFEPLVGLLVPALGTMLVLTRVIAVAVEVALVAQLDVAAKTLGPARFDVSHDAQVRAQHPMGVLRSMLRAVQHCSCFGVVRLSMIVGAGFNYSRELRLRESRCLCVDGEFAASNSRVDRSAQSSVDMNPLSVTCALGNAGVRFLLISLMILTTEQTNDFSTLPDYCADPGGCDPNTGSES